MVPALSQQIGMQAQSSMQQWHYVMQCFWDDTMVNWSDPGLISLDVNPLGVWEGWRGGAWGGDSTSWVRPATPKMWPQVIDWIILCQRYLSLRHYLAQPPEKISISPPPKRLAPGEKQELRGSLADAALAPGHFSPSSLWFVVLHTLGSVNPCAQKAISASNSLIKPPYIVQLSVIYHNPVRNVTVPA